MKMLKFEFFTLIVFLFLFVHFSNCQIHDDTRNSGTQGKDVVDATVRVLRRTAIFPGDQGFLRRLALVESAFGNDSLTYRPGYNGGVWQVDQSAFMATKDASTLQTYYDKIEAELGLKWDEVSWMDLRKPLYSAIAARLFILQTNQPIPGTIAAQALFWVRVYRPVGDSQKYVEEVRDEERDQTCSGMADICMVMDGSGSIGSTRFELAKEAAKRFSESFNLDPVLGTRIGFLVYSSTYYDHFDLNNDLTQAEMSARITGISYTGGSTSTGDGIMRGLHYFNTALPRADGVSKIMLTFTDGESNSGIISVNDAAAAVKSAGIWSIAVGIGTAFLNPVAQAELLTIAHGIEENVIDSEDYDAFLELVYILNGEVCRAPQTPPIGTNSTGVVELNERRYYKIPQQPDGVTVKVYTTGSFVGWYSYSEPNPNTAIYDGVITDDATFIPPASSRLARDGVERVYVTIQGTTPEEPTKYLLLIEDGNTVPQQESSPTTVESTTTTTTTEETTTTAESTTTTTEPTTMTITEEITTTTTEAATTTTTSTTQTASSSTGGQTTESEIATTTPSNPTVTFRGVSSKLDCSIIAFAICFIALLSSRY